MSPAVFYSLWVMDHFFQIGVIGPPENKMEVRHDPAVILPQESGYPS